MNTQIIEDYCSAEIVELLKEKGAMKDLDWRKSINSEWTFEWKITHQMTMKWLREKKHIFIRIIQSNIEYCSCEIYFDRARCYQFMVSFDSYEEACEAGIKYCLINLI